MENGLGLLAFVLFAVSSYMPFVKQQYNAPGYIFGLACMAFALIVSFGVFKKRT
jgi:hypothetical protein